MREGSVVVTGASRGIGAAIAADLHRRGMRVAGLSRSGECASGEGYACDVMDEGAIEATFAKIAADSPIVGLVNNAGQHTSGRTSELPTEAYEQVMRLNATSVLVASRTAYPHLVASGGGLIVNIGSFFDKMGVAGNLAYCASKAAVGAITRCCAVEWARDGIRVLDVAPGYVETDLNREELAGEKMRNWIARRVPTRRPGTTDEVARLIGALYAEGIPFLTGETIYVDGGQGMNL